MKIDSKARIVLVGAGIGGVTAAALLARRGYKVTLIEEQAYPGGCAATFERQGFRFDAGATVGCGFHLKGPLARLGDELDIAWSLMPSSVAWEYRCGDIDFQLSHSRAGILSAFPASRPFWQEQDRLASLLWSIAGETMPWPPSSLADYRALAAKAMGKLSTSLSLLGFSGKTTLQWLAMHGLDRDPDFVRFIDAQLLISVQTTAGDANALFAAIALDLPVRGTDRVTGGIGRVAELLAASIESDGGSVIYNSRVSRLERQNGRVVSVATRDGKRYPADLVIANLTPESLQELFKEDGGLRLNRQPAPLWGAFVLYLGVDEGVFGDVTCNHLQLIQPEGQLGEGSSLFISVSPSDDSLRAPEGYRAVTVSTHTRPGLWFDALKEGRESYESLKASYTSQMLSLLETRFKGISSRCRIAFAATPVTFERYTGRKDGYVGGYPQRSLFRVRGPGTPVKNLFLTGDSVFPGQSLPGVVSGVRRLVEIIEKMTG